MARTAAKGDGKLFIAVAIAEGNGFPCVVGRCPFRAGTERDLTVAELHVARLARDAHVREAHPDWQVDHDEVRVILKRYSER